MNSLVAIACTTLLLSACERSQAPSGQPINKPANAPRAPSPASSALDSSPTASADPLRFPEWPRLALGTEHSCFLDKNKQVWCWGSNLFGEIGNGKHGWTGSLEEMDNPDSHVKSPYRLPLDNISSLAARGGQSCAVDENGTLYAWGMGEGPQKYELRFVDKPIPRKTLHPVIHLSPGLKTCIVAQNGLPYCAGQKTNREEEEVANRSNEYGFYHFKLVSDLGPVLDIATSQQAACAVKTDKSVWCWGTNDYGELGRPPGGAHARPVQILGLKARKLAAGAYHFCAIDVVGTVHCWGQANHKQIANSISQRAVFEPTLVNLGEKPAVQLAASHFSNLVLSTDGSVWGWGDNRNGTLGALSTSDIGPVVRVISGEREPPLVQIAMGDHHACALRADESVWCWGQGDDYQLGNGKNEDSFAPVQVIFPDKQ